MGGLMVRFFPLAVEDLSCPDLTELPRSPRARLRPPTEAAESFAASSLQFLLSDLEATRFDFPEGLFVVMFMSTGTHFSFLSFFFFFSAAAAAAAAEDVEAVFSTLASEFDEFFLFSLLPSGSCPLSLPLLDPLTTASELVTESLFDIFEFEAGAFETEAGGEVTRGCSLSEGQLVVSAVVAACGAVV